MTLNGNNSYNPKAFISLFALPGEVYQSAWVEPTGDLVVSFTQEGVHRIHQLAAETRRILTENTDPELYLIKDDIDACINTLALVIDKVYKKMEVRKDD